MESIIICFYNRFHFIKRNVLYLIPNLIIFSIFGCPYWFTHAVVSSSLAHKF